MELVFATNNAHKLEEVRAVIPSSFKILSLADIGWNNEIPEDHHTFQENALQKAQVISEFSGLNTFADDSGLEVEALNGAPGVFSARYAGEPTNHARNNSKLLTALNGLENRRAQFRTVLALLLQDEQMFFEGTVKGTIASKEAGMQGFGYDPLFIPEGYDMSFAELGADLKNTMSHRRRALDLMCSFLAKKA